MSKNSFKSIINGAIASVIASVILFAVPGLRIYTDYFFSWLWSSVLWCWGALTDSYALPGWAWLPILFLSFVSCVNIYVASKRDTEEPDYKKFVEVHLYNVKWRWRWVGNNISDLWCFCPRCDATLVYDDISCLSRYPSIEKTDLICENCGNRVIGSVESGDKNYAIRAVEREIHRRIRTGEYKKH